MDIRDLALRSHGFAARSGRPAAATEDQAAVNNASQAAQAVQNAQVAQRTAATSDVAPAQNANDANAAAEATARQPATQERFSPAGRLLNVLQSVEQRHPEETKQVLSNIADRLRSDSENGGVFSERLSRWADRFQQAAETGDMSNLMPRSQQAHFGMRAYQQNQPADGDAAVEHVAGVAAEHASRPPAARSGVPDAPTEQAANVAATTIAPQKSSLVDNNGASDMRNNNQTPPIIVAAAS